MKLQAPRNLRLTWRAMQEAPAYSAVVVGGLAFGFAIVFLLLSFVLQSLRFDRHVPDHESVYVVKTQFNYNGPGGEWWQAAPQILKTALDNSGVSQSSTGFLPLTVHMAIANVPHEVRLVLVHSGYPAVFGQPETIDGDLTAALNRPDGLALTAQTAQRLFGETHVVGRSITMADKAFQVLAVLADQPKTTTFPYEALAGVGSAALSEPARSSNYTGADAWGWLNGGVFVRLGQGVTPEQVAAVLQRAVDDSPLNQEKPPELIAKLGDEKLMRIALGALVDAYFDPQVSPSPTTNLHGDLRLLQGLLWVALLILLLSAANYVNLATVRTLRRQREIAIRKVLGARAGQLVRQLIGESMLVVLAAGLIGLGLALALAPVFSSLVNGEVGSLWDPVLLGLLTLVMVTVGVLAGAYPAWVALGIPATLSLAGRGRSETRTGLWVRRMMTTLQFTVAMALCAIGGAIAWQSRFASQHNPGFDPGPLLVVDLPRNMDDPQGVAFRDAVARLPEADGVTVSWDAVARHQVQVISLMRRDGGDMTTVEVKGIRPDFFEVYRVPSRTGRLFDSRRDAMATDEAVLDGAAVHALGFSSPSEAVGRSLIDESGKRVQIIGVAADIRFDRLDRTQSPIVYTLQTTTQTMTVRAREDLGALRTALETQWKQHFPNNVMRVTPARAFFEAQYAESNRLASALELASLEAFLIAAFGVYVLAAYNVQRREIEITLRKLHGAGNRHIGGMLAREFAVVLGVSSLIALPVAWVGIDHYLGEYSVHAPWVWWPLALALALAVITVGLSTWRHMRGAMRLYPARLLRSE